MVFKRSRRSNCCIDVRQQSPKGFREKLSIKIETGRFDGLVTDVHIYGRIPMKRHKVFTLRIKTKEM